MTATEALKLIVENKTMPALNYAVNYAIAALQMDINSHEFKVQCIYVVGNISNWRARKQEDIRSGLTKELIKDARKALKDAAGIK